MFTFTKALPFVALFAVLLTPVTTCLAAENDILEFEGKMPRTDGTLHYSYVFLPKHRLVIELNFDSEGASSAAGFGRYEMDKKGQLTIRWSAGGHERGAFSKDETQYSISEHTDKSQVGAVTKGHWQRLTDPDRLTNFEAYVRKVVVPTMRHEENLRRQLSELEYLQFKTSMDIIEMWSKLP